MADAKKAPAPAPEPAAAPAKPKKNILLVVAIVLLVLLIVVVGAVGFFFIKAISPPDVAPPETAQSEEASGGGHEEAPAKKKKSEKKSKSDHPDKPVFVKLDTFTVNLQGGSTVLQTEIHVEVADEKQKEVITGYMPRISSQVNLLLSSKKPEELATLEGKKKLMEDIKGAVNAALGAKHDEDGAMSVEFKTFIVQ